MSNSDQDAEIGIPSKKKAKLNNDGSSSKSSSPPDVDSISYENAMEAMDFYREYCESMGQDDGEERMDENLKNLENVLSILSIDDIKDEKTTNYGTHDYLNTFIGKLECTSKNDVVDKLQSIPALIPVLISMTYLHLWLAKSEQTDAESNDNDNGTSSSSISNNENLPYLFNSLKHFPYNAGALSVLANHLRMNRMTSLEQIYTLYDLSSDNASAIRDGAISILEEEKEDKAGSEGSNDEKENIDPTDVKENEESVELKVWTEMLLLDGIAGVEYLGGEMVVVDEDDEEVIEDTKNLPGMECFGSDEEEEEKEEEEKKASDKSSSKKETDELEVVMESVEKINAMIDANELERGNSSEDFSPSEIEATSSFMAALLSSTLGKHNDALKHLRKFCITHRIHPNIWDGAVSGRRGNKSLLHESENCSPDSESRASFTPIMYSGSDGILPAHKYDRLCQVFHPKASYWKESDYENRGYYSFWIDLQRDDINKSQSSKPSSPKNIIEDVIRNHLLPLVRKTLKKENSDEIVGAEWWTHTRPIQANLGHQLHFDTDEALLEQEQKVTHPIASSVLYLTTGSKKNEETASGSTIVFDQDPDSVNVASKAWVSQGKDNSFMIFPGNLLHGVLPCPGKKNNNTAGNEKRDEVINRLTLMVGFWTRRVPDNMPKDRDLYGPCGNLPPSTTTHSWVQQIAQSYGESNNTSYNYNTSPASKVLPFISPAWEYIEYDDEDEEKVPLDLPPGIDHRYFVHGAPGCFRASLFKDESF